VAIEKQNLILFQSPTSGIQLYDELAIHDWDVHIASTIRQASDLINKNSFHVGLCLIENQSNADHFAKLKQLFNSYPGISWIMGLPGDVSPEMDNNSIESKLIAEYCFDYITFPVDIKRLLFALGHAQGMNKISRPIQKQIDGYASSFGIIGDSPAMVSLFKLLQKVAKEDCSVLIQGETGTGKELIANAIHNNSIRSEHPLITINCGAFPKDLIQSELFGHEKGAFTGALQRKIGRIESAEGGTLFLDEIGDLPFEQQVNLLRFLEDRMIRRIGGSENIPVNVRIIAATHVDLKAAVQKKQFREDLYFRLQVLQIETPPLRARGKDIESLACYFFNKFSENNVYTAKGFQAESLNLLNCYEWPGNVRELMNCIRHAVVMSENTLLTPEDLGMDRKYQFPAPLSLDEGRAVADRNLILSSMHHTNNNVCRAAEILGISRVSLYRLIDKYRISVAMLLLLAIIPLTIKYGLSPHVEDYYTLSTAAPEAPACLKLRVVFTKSMPDVDIDSLLEKIHGQLVEGPNNAGAYTICLEADRDSQDLNAAIILLRNRKDVYLAEPVMDIE
jgi:DNA-binding NtrC family response regulator